MPTSVKTIIPDTGFVRLPTILAVFPISRSSWWAGVRSGKYPPSIKLSKRVTAWRAEDIKELIENAKKSEEVVG